MVIILIILCFLFSAAFGFSIIVFTTSNQTSNTITIFGNATVLLHDFNIQFYDSALVNAVSTQAFSYEVSLCQVNCGDRTSIINIEPVIFSRCLNTIKYPRQYAKFQNSTQPNVNFLSLLMLKGSAVVFTLVPPPNTDQNFTLNIFYNLSDCEDFLIGCNSSTPAQVLSLNQSGEFKTNFATIQDGYVCAVLDLLTINDTYNYTMNTTARRYHNVSYLNSSGECLTNHVNQTEDSEVSVPQFSLHRPLGARFQRQETCLLLTLRLLSDVEKDNSYTLSATIFKSKDNPQTISFSAVSIFFVLFGVMSIFVFVFLCVCLISTHKKIAG